MSLIELEYYVKCPIYNEMIHICNCRLCNHCISIDEGVIDCNVNTQ